MNKVSPVLYGLKKSLLYAAVSIIMTLIYFIIGIDTQPMLTGIINIVVTVLLLVYIIKSFRKALGGYMKLGQGMCMITVMGLASTIIMYLYNLVYVNYIDTNFVEKSLMQTQKMMASMGGANDEVMDAVRTQLEAQMSFSFSNLCLALLGAGIMYVIAGLILGAVFRKSDPESID